LMPELTPEPDSTSGENQKKKWLMVLLDPLIVDVLVS
jgi:hypothetical protein